VKLSWLPICWIIVGLIACGPSRTLQTSPPALNEWREPFSVVEELWRAAEANDAESIARVSVGEGSSEWIQARRGAYPSFFSETSGELVLEGGYELEGPDLIVLQFRAPFVTCPPPTYEGVDDTYFVRARRLSGEWRVEAVWQNIC